MTPLCASSTSILLFLLQLESHLHLLLLVFCLLSLATPSRTLWHSCHAYNENALPGIVPQAALKEARADNDPKFWERLDIISVSIFVTALSSLSEAENESLNALLNWSQVPRLLFSLACVQKDCFHDPAVPSFIKDRVNMICLLLLLYVSSFMVRYMLVSIRNSSSFFLSPVNGVGVSIFTSF